MEAKVYKEFQKPGQAFIWIVCGSLAVLFLWAVIQQLILDIPFGNNPMSDKGLSLMLLIPVLVFVLLIKTELRSQIDESGIKYQLYPLQLKMRQIKWDEIEKLEIRKYKALREFGGYGIRYGFAGKAINIRGYMGLQIYFKNGKKLLLGTQKPKQVEEVLRNLGKLPPVKT